MVSSEAKKIRPWNCNRKNNLHDRQVTIKGYNFLGVISIPFSSQEPCSPWPSPFPAWAARQASSPFLKHSGVYNLQNTMDLVRTWPLDDATCQLGSAPASMSYTLR